MVVRRFVTLAVSFCLVLAIGLTRVEPLFAQGKPRKSLRPPRPRPPRRTPKTEATKTDSAKTEPPRKTTAKTEAPKATEPPLPPIPPEVQAKIDAARKAVAEAIVAAQDAGLVETSIDPPPILDILITGRATDTRALKSTTAKKPYAVSPKFSAPGSPDTASSRASTTRKTFGSSTRAPGSSSGTTRAPHPGAVHPGDPQGQGPAATAKKEEAKPAETKKAANHRRRQIQPRRESHDADTPGTRTGLERTSGGTCRPDPIAR